MASDKFSPTETDGNGHGAAPLEKGIRDEDILSQRFTQFTSIPPRGPIPLAFVPALYMTYTPLVSDLPGRGV